MWPNIALPPIHCHYLLLHGCLHPIHCHDLLVYDCHVTITWPSVASPPIHCHFLLLCGCHVTQCRTAIHYFLLYDCHVIITWPSLAPPYPPSLPTVTTHIGLFLLCSGSLPKRPVTWSSVTSQSIQTPTTRTLLATTTRNAGPGMPECASWNTTSTCESLVVLLPPC